jgi:hypothetical protein
MCRRMPRTSVVLPAPFAESGFRSCRNQARCETSACRERSAGVRRNSRRSCNRDHRFTRGSVIFSMPAAPPIRPCSATADIRAWLAAASRNRHRRYRAIRRGSAIDGVARQGPSRRDGLWRLGAARPAELVPRRARA